MEQTKQFRKNFIWNTLGTGFNAFNSLFFMIIATRVNGVEEAGVFTIAFSTACIMYAIGLYAGRIYQVTELNKTISDKDFIISRVITNIIMIVALLAFCFIRKYDIEKTMVFLLLTVYKALEAFSDVIYGVLQKKEELDIVGKSLFVKSALSVLLFLIINLITKNMIISIISMIITCILIIVFYDFKKANKYIDYKIKVKSKNVINILKKGFFTFAISFLGMYVLNAPKYSIDTYLSNDFQTIFGIIVMPATIVGLVAQFLIHPYLTQILDLYEKADLKKLKKLILKLLVLVIGFGIIATIAGYLIGTQILGIIYGLDLSSYKLELAIIIVSATLYTIVTIYSSVLTTVRETFSQFIIYAIVAIGAYILSNILTKIWEINGAVIAYFSIMALGAIIYTIYTNLKLSIIFKKLKPIEEKE